MERKEQYMKTLMWKIHVGKTVEGWLFLIELEKNYNDYCVIILTKDYIWHLSLFHTAVCRVQCAINKNQ